MNIRLVLFLLILSNPMTVIAQPGIPDEWRTDYEKSGYFETPKYAETIAYCRKLEKGSSWISLKYFGKSAQGRDLPLLILSKERAFTPEKAGRSSRPLVLVQSGIHAGEIDGKDASLQLIRDMAILRKNTGLLENCNLLFIPIFNVDGHERMGPANRINQNGPREMGWRVTAQNLNLNRDFLKADAPEMRAWLALFHAWKPDMIIDCHVTDGVDFQYSVTYIMEKHENAPEGIVAWQKGLETYFIQALNASGNVIAPYVFPREEADLSKGLLQGASPPRFSTGYAAILNRASLLIETHMLKNYRTRVEGTYRLLTAVLEYIGMNPAALKEAVRKANRETVEQFGNISSRPPVPLQFRLGERADTMRFKGYRSEQVQSPISGGTYTRWSRDTMTVVTPVFSDVTPTIYAKPPLCYIIPREWSDVLDIVTLHGLKLDRLSKDIDIPVESYRFRNPRWREQPYEGRHPVTFETDTIRSNRFFSKGDYVVRLDQASARAAIHLLEPGGPDSFVHWGFFDAIFEKKEYFETYIMEEIAKSMMKNDPSLRDEFEKRLSADTSFAKNPRRRLDFFHQRSPFADSRWMIYPVARYMEPIPLPLEKRK